MSKQTDVSYTYIVECSDGTFYTGWTNDIKRRILVHNAKKGAKYTRSRTPVKLVYLEKSDTREQAMRREAQIKRLSRHQKEQLIKDGKDLYGNNQI
ncbi:MAG: GIY-YIG nuclease family protein [Eubacterium sp.]|jgi:putative endonuclease|nr:GIY-YIG nuclease family protein [Eubacterium sp.]